MDIKAAFFDFGGVYYSDGFREGLFTIAREVGAKGDDLYRIGMDAVFSTGYVTGKVPEMLFWESLASESGISENLYPFRDLILKAFQPDTDMAALVREVRDLVPVALLTDQTNWLYELHARDGFLAEFDDTINSYEEGFSKQDSEIFRIACSRMNLFPEEAIFFDDNPGNVQRGVDFGIHSILFTDARDAREAFVSSGVFKDPGTQGS